jgi:hypothetical protein
MILALRHNLYESIKRLFAAKVPTHNESNFDGLGPPTEVGSVVVENEKKVSSSEPGAMQSSGDLEELMDIDRCRWGNARSHFVSHPPREGRLCAVLLKTGERATLFYLS